MVDRVLCVASSALLVLTACGGGGETGSDPDAAPPATDAAAPDAFEGPIDPEEPDAGPPDATPPDTRARKVLLIGIDGVRHDKLAIASIPQMRALAARGIMTRTWIFAAPMAGTVSGPSWGSILTGVWPDKHRVLDNEIRNHALAQYPDFLTRIETARPALHTYAIANWRPLTDTPGPLIGSTVDTRVIHDGYAETSWAASDVRITNEAVEALRTQDQDAAFVYLGNVDMIGHSGDTDLRYVAAIEQTDRQIGQLIEAVEARPTFAQENWLFVVTTDHGHRDGGNHGSHTWQERQSFVIAAGGDIPHATLPFEARNVDIVPTIFAHMGIAVDPAWDLDGVPLGTAAPDVFDGMTARLRPALDETAVPGLGWTHDLPAGWTLDTANMMGGTAEWRGWSLVTSEFWNLTEPGQSREAFVRSRGVIAVADSDEWDDHSPLGDRRFDSTMKTSPFNVAGKTTVRLRFASHYLQEGSQRGTVTVSFDMAAPQIVLRYGPDAGDVNRGGHVISRIETVPIQVPPGARTMTVSWRLFDAQNNWYWAVDDPRVE